METWGKNDVVLQKTVSNEKALRKMGTEKHNEEKGLKNLTLAWHVDGQSATANNLETRSCKSMAEQGQGGNNREINIAEIYER